MSGEDDYLSRLDKLRVVNQDLARKESKQREDETNEAIRRSKFRDARKPYRERKREQWLPMGQAYYFLGSSQRKQLDYETAIKSFGESYVREHAKLPERMGDLPRWDAEGERKVTNEEIGERRAEIQSIAYSLMNSNEPSHYMMAAKLYAKLGKGGKIVPKLLKKVEKSQSHRIALSDRDLLYIKMLIKKREEGRQPSKSGIEGRTVIFVASFLAGIVLSFFSVTSTGNVTGNLTGTNAGLLGVFLFIFGLAGLFFSAKK